MCAASLPEDLLANRPKCNEYDPADLSCVMVELKTTDIASMHVKTMRVEIQNGVDPGVTEKVWRCGSCTFFWLQFPRASRSSSHIFCDPFPFPLAINITVHIIMLQQRLARSFQTLSRQSQCLGTPRATHPTPFSVSTLRLAPAASASQSIAARRWYSSQQESEAKQEEVSKENTEGPKETPKEDVAKENPLGKELEAKRKESLELTVRTAVLC